MTPRTIAIKAVLSVLLLAPLPALAQAQAVQVVAAIAQYVGLTAAFAEAVDQLAEAVTDSYAAGRGIADDVGCRDQKAALGQLVIELRDLEREKTALHTGLSRAVHFPRGPGDWRQIRGQAERVRTDIVELERMIAAEKGAFATNAAMSRAYGDLLISFDDKQRLVRDLVEEMNGVDWDWRRLDQRSLDPHVEELERLEEALAAEVATIAVATDVIADHLPSLCAVG